MIFRIDRAVYGPRNIDRPELRPENGIMLMLDSAAAVRFRVNKRKRTT